MPAAAATRPWAEPRHPVLIEAGPAPAAAPRSAGSAAFRSATGLFHQKFGTGTVTAVEDNKLAIRFEHAGDKKIMDAYVERRVTGFLLIASG